MQVDALTSIQYMESDAYRETYGELPVWHHYRPNHPGGRPRKITRRSCVVSLISILYKNSRKFIVAIPVRNPWYTYSYEAQEQLWLDALPNITNDF